MDDREWDDLEGGRDEDDSLNLTPIDAQVDIQALLDVGYEQLDGFARWLEEKLGVTTRFVEQDCFNTESMIDFLANKQRKSVSEIDEFDLRWFVFSQYIRTAMSDAETQLRLPESLERFFQYLKAEHVENVPEWVPMVLDDRMYYQSRRTAFHALDAEDEETWEEGMREWNQELQEDLDTRCLWLPRDLGDGMTWGGTMGWFEAALYDEASRTWQSRRNELLREGYDYDVIRERLEVEYLAWIDNPQSRLDEMTPREAIYRERLERADPEEEE